MTPGSRVLVTGGGGFLGRRIVEMLVDRGATVRSFSRSDYPELRRIGVDVMQGNLENAEDVRRACDGCEMVFHVAARPGIWGRFDDYYRPNVLGTQNVLAACRAGGVARLVYTSSPSVIFDGNDMEGVNESVPYPRHYTAHYPKTKAIAEQDVLAANGGSFATVALRPHLVWGPRDNHLIPRVMARARALRRIGKVNKLIDSTYIDNAAEAHLLAAGALAVGKPPAGRPYFISNGEPRPIWDLIGAILATANLPPVTRSIPMAAAYCAAAILETFHNMLGLDGEPRITRFLIHELTTAHWFDISAARRDFEYMPRTSIDNGLAKLRAIHNADML